MSVRVCKECNKEKQYIYFCLDGQGRSVYKDEDGHIWHGRSCYICFKSYIKTKAEKIPLCDVICKHCGKSFKQRAIKQFVCSKECYKLYKK
jgi:hypothetical protein